MPVETLSAEKLVDISVTINLDGTGESNISAGNGVLDHMINQLTRHVLIDIELQA